MNNSIVIYIVLLFLCITVSMDGMEDQYEYYYGRLLDSLRNLQKTPIPAPKPVDIPYIVTAFEQTKKRKADRLEDVQELRKVDATKKVCTGCGYVAETKYMYERHLDASHNLTLVCNTCDLIFVSRAAGNQHTSEKGHSVKFVPEPRSTPVSQLNYVVCEKCGCSLQKQCLKYHMTRPHNLKLKCGECRLIFPCHLARRTHVDETGHNTQMSICLAKDPETDVICGATFLRKTERKRHERSENQHTIRECNFCPERRFSTCAINQHEEEAHPEKTKRKKRRRSERKKTK